MALVLFDVPTSQNTQRKRLRRYLRDKGFGSVQNSVWVTPDPLTEERQILGGGKINVELLLLREARPCAGESDAEIVAGAWDFERINRHYCPASENPRRATGRRAAERRDGEGIAALGGGGWKCSGTPAGNCARSTAPDSATKDHRQASR